MIAARTFAFVAALLMALLMHTHHACHECLHAAGRSGSDSIALADHDGGDHECCGLCELEAVDGLTARTESKTRTHEGATRAPEPQRIAMPCRRDEEPRVIRPPPLWARAEQRARSRDARRGSVQRR